MERRRFEILYDPGVRAHLRAIDRRHHGEIREWIEEQLRFDPEVRTRNRKPLAATSAFRSAWELRFGSDNRFRVFYRTDAAGGNVHVLAIGEKRGSRLSIGGEEFEL